MKINTLVNRVRRNRAIVKAIQTAKGRSAAEEKTMPIAMGFNKNGKIPYDVHRFLSQPQYNTHHFH